MTEELEAKVKKAYGVALSHAHDGGSIQIHIGTELLAHLKAMAAVPESRVIPSPMLFGFPLIPANEHLGPDYIGVHVVHHIH